MDTKYPKIILVTKDKSVKEYAGPEKILEDDSAKWAWPSIERFKKETEELYKSGYGGLMEGAKKEFATFFVITEGSINLYKQACLDKHLPDFNPQYVAGSLNTSFGKAVIFDGIQYPPLRSVEHDEETNLQYGANILAHELTHTFDILHIPTSRTPAFHSVSRLFIAISILDSILYEKGPTRIYERAHKKREYDGREFEMELLPMLVENKVTGYEQIKSPIMDAFLENIFLLDIELRKKGNAQAATKLREIAQGEGDNWLDSVFASAPYLIEVVGRIISNYDSKKPVSADMQNTIDEYREPITNALTEYMKRLRVEIETGKPSISIV